MAEMTTSELSHSTYMQKGTEIESQEPSRISKQTWVRPEYLILYITIGYYSYPKYH